MPAMPTLFKARNALINSRTVVMNILRITMSARTTIMTLRRIIMNARPTVGEFGYQRAA